MSSIVKKLKKNKLIAPQHDFVSETVYEVIMGSMAYGLQHNKSDVDVYAVCVPDKSMVFPHLNGHIYGFGPSPANFEVYQQHHIHMNSNEYDINVYGIVRYFDLCRDNNPNMIDSLFVPDRCVLYKDDVGDHMRVNRHLFLSKRIYDKMRGYAFSEFKKLQKEYNPETNAKRYNSVQEFGYDTKSAYHIFRLMLEAEMVLTEADLNLERNREQLKFVREGNYNMEQIEKWFFAKDKALTTIHANSDLPVQADYERLRELLMECLEIHFGSLDNLVGGNSEAEEILRKIARLIPK